MSRRHAKLKRPSRKRCLVIVPAMMAAAARGFQFDGGPQDEAHWWNLKLTGGYLNLEAEANQDTASSANGGGSITVRRFYVAPTVGITANGSLYHPDLLTYDLLAEPGYIWEQTGSAGGGATSESSYLQNYSFSGTLLQTKPYSSRLFASGSHDIYQYDFFNSATVDTRSWGASTGYRAGPVPVTLSFQQSHEDSSGLSQHSTLDQTTLDLRAHNERHGSDVTDFSYDFGQFDRSTTDTGATFSDNNTYHYITLTDAEHFHKSTLNSTLLFNELETDGAPSRDLDTQLDLDVDHTKNLHSFYNYGFTYYSDDQSDVYQHNGRAGLQHQLYESLTTGADVHGSLMNSDALGTSLEAKTGGMLGALTYTKRLGSWGRITIGNTATYDFTEQSSSGSSTLVIPNENHTLTAQGQPLAYPRVVAIASVIGTNGATLHQGPDYQVITNAAVLEIASAPGGAYLGQPVQVTYYVEANPSGCYSTFEDQFQARIDLFDRMLAFYCRLDLIENYINSPGFILENLHEFQAGEDFSWKGLLLDARYTDFDSSFYRYYSTMLTEGYSVALFGDSTLGVDFEEQWSTFPSDGFTPRQHATFYNALGRYQWRPVGTGFTWSLEGGVERQRGHGLDQDLATARTHFDWQMGKLVFHMGYEYQSQDFTGELRQQHYLFLRVRRNF